jgi:O-antigen ligase
LLGAAVAMFGGVYFWSAALLAAGAAAVALSSRPWRPSHEWTAVDLSVLTVLAAVAIQLVSLPVSVMSVVSPARVAYARAATLDAAPASLLPLTLDREATLHAFVATICVIATFWIARGILARGGVRTLITSVAWIAVALVLVTLAQSATNSTLVYGVWRPYDAGARPLGPFINRNHAGTWSLMALMLCFGCFQWRRASSPPSRGWRWRNRLAHALNGRSLILALAVVLLTVNVALGASRSTMLALALAAGYVAWAAPRRIADRGGWLWTSTTALAALLALVAFANLDTLLSRIDETRQLGFSGRIAIWRDTLLLIRDFPLAGVGAGNFSNAMRLYQTTDRTYFWNEAHNQYLQVAAEGGVLIAVPVAAALAAITVTARRVLGRPNDPLLWMRVGAAGALVAVAIQAIWETGLSLPANGMLAAVATAILVHEPRQIQTSNAAARD